MEEVMACLKATHPTLSTDMEVFVKELSVVLQPEPQELFLMTLKQLIQKCYESRTQADLHAVKDILHQVCQFNFLYLIPQSQTAKVQCSSFDEYENFTLMNTFFFASLF